MGLKYKYESTSRRDIKELARNVRPGDHLYVIQDVSQIVAPLEDAQLYTEFIVTKDKAPFTGTPMVCSTSAHRLVGTTSVTSLLIHYGDVYSQRPAGIRHIAEEPPLLPEFQHLAERVAREHAADVAVARSEAAASGRRRWF